MPLQYPCQATPQELYVRPGPLKSEKLEGDVDLLIMLCWTDDRNGLFDPLSEYGDWGSRPSNSVDEGVFLWIMPRIAKVGTQRFPRESR
jgi:hypothetical protein